jgi:capsular polysaccharide biosynthesis protein
MKLIRQRWQTIILLSLMITAIVFSVSAFIKPQYQAESRILVMDKKNVTRQDDRAGVYAIILAQFAGSTTFLDDLRNSPSETKKLVLGADNSQSRKLFQQYVKVAAEKDTGVITIFAIGQSRRQAEELNQAVAVMLVSNAKKYLGSGDELEVKQFDSPTSTSKPVKPNLLINTLIGFVIGLAVSFGVVIYFPDFDKKSTEEMGTKEVQKKKLYWQGREIQQTPVSVNVESRLKKEISAMKDILPAEEPPYEVPIKKVTSGGSVEFGEKKLKKSASIGISYDFGKKLKISSDTRELPQQEIRQKDHFERRQSLSDKLFSIGQQPVEEKFLEKKLETSGEISLGSFLDKTKSPKSAIVPDADAGKADIAATQNEEKTSNVGQDKKAEAQKVQETGWARVAINKIPENQGMPFVEVDENTDVWQSLGIGVAKKEAEGTSEQGKNILEKEVDLMGDEISNIKEADEAAFEGSMAAIDKEPTEEEIKERLNRLLKGQL